MGSPAERLEQRADARLEREAKRERHSTMTSTISTFTNREPKAWKAPEFESPLLIKARDLRPLGEVRGYLWWTHPKHDGELVERPKRLTDRDVLPNRMLVQVDEKGERSYRIFDIYAPGTFAASADTFGPPPPSPLKFAAALPAIIAPRKRPKLSNRIGGTLSSGFGDLVDARDRDPIVRQPEVRLYGAAARLADWAKRGVVVTLAADREHEVVRERNGVLSHHPRLVQEMRDALPLTLPYLRGDPAPTCVVGTHANGEDASAVDVGVLGAVSCLRHVQERQP